MGLSTVDPEQFLCVSGGLEFKKESEGVKRNVAG